MSFNRLLNLCASIAALSVLTFIAVPVQAKQASVHRLVIEFKSQASGVPQVQTQSFQQRMSSTAAQVDRLASVHGKTMKTLRPFGVNGAVVLANDSSADQLLQRLSSDPNVVSVALDRRIRLSAQSPLVGLLNGLDVSRRSRSWFHQALSSQPASINTGAMWTNFHGTSPTVVAVLDTGVLPSHPMLQGHLLPGYDFVADPLIGADGEGVSAGNSRDANPIDPGDGVSATDLAADPACTSIRSSSWHGTFVSGLLAGNPIPAEGIFSVNWNASILPVRVLGKCGGFSSDLADGIRWAAGLPVAGAPSNPFPARVINLSLGAQGACEPSIEGAAVSAARQAGSLVVVAAGNEGSTVDSPANCPGAFGVAAIDQEGLKASYSNAGSTVQLSAPGGDSAFPIWSASNTGINTAGSNTYGTKVGTSFATPMVAAAASLYLSLNSGASVSTLESMLKSSARPFLSIAGNPTCSSGLTNTACNCTTALCGAGMLDVSSLVRSASSAGLTNLFSNTGNVIRPGGSTLFSAIGSTNSSNQEVGAVVFELINVIKSNSSTPSPSLSVNGLDVTVSAPVGVSGFDLKATVSSGSSAVASITVAEPGATSTTLLASILSPLIGAATPADSPIATPGSSGTVDGSSGSAPSGSGGGGGGGGALGLLGLGALSVLLALFRCGVKTKI